MHCAEVAREPAKAQPQHPRSEVRRGALGQDEEPRVVGDEVKAAKLLLGQPPDPAVAGLELERTGVPTHERQPVLAEHCDVAHTSPDQAPEGQIVVRAHQRIPADPLVGAHRGADRDLAQPSGNQLEHRLRRGRWACAPLWRPRRHLSRDPVPPVASISYRPGKIGLGWAAPWRPMASCPAPLVRVCLRYWPLNLHQYRVIELAPNGAKGVRPNDAPSRRIINLCLSAAISCAFSRRIPRVLDRIVPVTEIPGMTKQFSARKSGTVEDSGSHESLLQAPFEWCGSADRRVWARGRNLRRIVSTGSSTDFVQEWGFSVRRTRQLPNRPSWKSRRSRSKSRGPYCVE